MEHNAMVIKVPGWKLTLGSELEKVAKGKMRNAIMFRNWSGLDRTLATFPTRQWNAMNRNHPFIFQRKAMEHNDLC
jgi:hypothetical protein